MEVLALDIPEFGPALVLALRLIVPLSILRYPLGGAIAAMILDACDVVLLTLIGRGEFADYHATDKYLDMYYLTLAVFVSRRWSNALARRTSIVLFVYRAIGFVAFEATQMRALLFLFPNLFENFYLFYLASLRILGRDLITSRSKLALWLAILLVPKLAQEYLLHVLEAQPWNWIRRNLLGGI